MAVKYTMGPKVPAPTWRPLPPIAASRPPAKPFTVPTFSTPRPPGTAPAPAPGSPPPGNLGLPPDPGYDQVRAGLERQRDTRLAGLGQQRQAGLLTYGYREDPATGQIAFDAANPFSQAAMMYRQWDQARAGTSQSMASRGQLYAGSLQAAQNEVAFGRQQGEDSLQKAVAAFLARNTQDSAETRSQFEIDAGSAMGDRIARVGDNPLYEPVIDGGPVAAAAAAAARTAAAARPAGSAAAKAVAGKMSGAKPKPKVKVKLKGSSSKGKYTMGPKKLRP